MRKRGAGKFIFIEDLIRIIKEVSNLQSLKPLLVRACLPVGGVWGGFYEEILFISAPNFLNRPSISW